LVKITLMKGHVLDCLKRIPDNSVDCIITSPPYWSLRRYPDSANIQWDDGWYGQLGLEPTLEMYIEHLLQITKELKRVLKPSGILFWNHGDSYCGSGKGAGTKKAKESYIPEKRPKLIEKLPHKCMAMQNYRLVLRMVDEQGWILRNIIIWHKPNALPESVKDRFSKKYEPIFMLVNNKKYFFNLDAVRVPLKSIDDSRLDEHGFVNPAKLYNSKWKGKKAPFPTSFNYRVREAKKGHFEILGVRASEEEMKKYDKQGRKCSILNQDGLGRPNRNIELLKSIGEVWSESSSALGVNLKGKNPGDVWTITTQPFPDAHFACVTPDTEILTENGWKKYTELKENELVATYNMEKKVIEFQPLEYVKEYDFEGELIHVGNRDLDILMTPNHRNVVKKRNGKEVIVLAKDLAYSDKIRIRAKFDCPEEYPPINEGIGEDLARLIGWIVAEGHYRKDCYGISIYQNKNKHEKEIDSLLNKLGIPHSKRERARYYKGKKRIQIEWYLLTGFWTKMIREICPKKKLNKFLAFLPINEAKALFESIIKGDGSVRKDDERICITIKDRENRDWLSILALRLGYLPIDGKKDIYLTKREFIGIRGTNGKGKSIYKVHYKGKVWCPKTPNGTWVARRNGRVFITGNTFPEELVRRCIKAGCPKDGIVLDPFVGSGTTLKVAIEERRNAIGIDIVPEYIEMTKKRINWGTPFIEWELIELDKEKK